MYNGLFFLLLDFFIKLLINKPPKNSFYAYQWSYSKSGCGENITAANERLFKYSYSGRAFIFDENFQNPRSLIAPILDNDSFRLTVQTEQLDEIYLHSYSHNGVIIPISALQIEATLKSVGADNIFLTVKNYAFTNQKQHTLSLPSSNDLPELALATGIHSLDVVSYNSFYLMQVDLNGYDLHLSPEFLPIYNQIMCPNIGGVSDTTN